MRRPFHLLFVIFLVLSAVIAGCSKNGHDSKTHKLQVVATLFPLYDFARQVGGDKVDVKLLLPPGLEPHSFEPKPEDMVRISRSDVFIFTNRYMEPWAESLLKGRADADKLTVVDAGAGVPLEAVAEGDGDDDHGHGHPGDRRLDPHIWLSPANAVKMVQNIAAAFVHKDPANKATYERNAAAFVRQLEDLDARFREGLSQCRSRTLIHGGHYAFGYLARRYGLSYSSAYELSANSEPTPKKLVDLVDRMKRDNIHAIFYEELISPAMAEMIARETGAQLVKLHGIHNVTRDELKRGVTYLSLMEKNLENLRKGLECR